MRDTLRAGCDKFPGGAPISTDVDDDELAALLAEARATSERRSTLTPTEVRRVGSAGARHVLVDLVRMVPLLVTLALVVALARSSGFF